MARKNEKKRLDERKATYPASDLRLNSKRSEPVRVEIVRVGGQTWPVSFVNDKFGVRTPRGKEKCTGIGMFHGSQYSALITNHCHAVIIPAALIDGK